MYFMRKPTAVYECRKGLHAITLLSERRDKMAKKRWLQTTA